MDQMQEEQFTKTLLGLLDKAKTKKNVLEYNEISDAFASFELDEDKMDLILEFLEKNHVDIMQNGVKENDGEDLLIDNDDDVILAEAEEVELIDDVDVLEGVSTEDPVRMYLKEIGKCAPSYDGAGGRAGKTCGIRR